MPTLLNRRQALLGLSALLGTTAPLSFAASGAKSRSKKSQGRSKPAAAPSGSEESRADRDRRLSRECRGRPNAGACLGYTQ
jgi:hypothetical protein